MGRSIIASAENAESPCTSLGVVADQVVTVGLGYGYPRAGLPPWVINVHGRQVFHLVSGDAEMDKESPDLSHSADRDSHILAAPHVPLLEEHVGYMVAARFHDQPLDLPYLAVGRTDGQPAVYLYLAEWDGVDGDFLRVFRSARAAAGPDLDRTGNPENSGGQRKKARARGGVGLLGPAGVEVRHDLGLLGGSERLELG